MKVPNPDSNRPTSPKTSKSKGMQKSRAVSDFLMQAFPTVPRERYQEPPKPRMHLLSQNTTSADLPARYNREKHGISPTISLPLRRDDPIEGQGGLGSHYIEVIHSGFHQNCTPIRFFFKETWLFSNLDRHWNPGSTDTATASYLLRCCRCSGENISRSLCRVVYVPESHVRCNYKHLPSCDFTIPKQVAGSPHVPLHRYHRFQPSLPSLLRTP